MVQSSVKVTPHCILFTVFGQRIARKASWQIKFLLHQVKGKRIQHYYEIFEAGSVFHVFSGLTLEIIDVMIE